MSYPPPGPYYGHPYWPPPPPPMHGPPPPMHGLPPPMHGHPPPMHGPPPPMHGYPPPMHGYPPPMHGPPPQMYGSPQQMHEQPPMDRQPPPMYGSPMYEQSSSAGTYPYYAPATMPMPDQQYNYAYPEGQPQSVQPLPEPVEEPVKVSEQVQVAELSGEFEWVPTTSTLANTLVGRAVEAGNEGWDGSPLWVIRATHNGELIPGKMSIRHNSASIAYRGKEVPVQNIEVLCSKPEGLRWVPAQNGEVPPSAIPGGQSSDGEQLFIGRGKYQLSLTPGKVQTSQGACFISFGGQEVALNTYDVLCRIS